MYLLILWKYSHISLFNINVNFVRWIVISALAQSVATALQIELLGRRSLATGVVLVKTEAVFALLIGYVCIGDVVSWLGFASVVLGVIGIICVVTGSSKDQESHCVGTGHLRQFLETAVLGVSSALLFAITGVAARAATRSIVGVGLIAAVAMTLAATIIIQVLFLGVYLVWKNQQRW